MITIAVVWLMSIALTVAIFAWCTQDDPYDEGGPPCNS